MLIKSRLLSAGPEIKLMLTARWIIVNYCCHSKTRLSHCLTPPLSQPQGHGYWGQYHHQWPRDLGGHIDPGSQPRPWLITDNLPTLGHTPIPLLTIDTAEDRGRGRTEDVAEAAAELRHGVLELTEQPHLTISRGRRSLELGNKCLNIPSCLVSRLEIWQ